jgi:hypothetical protein
MATELEKRLARLEARVQLMEDRRKAIVPAELDEDPSLNIYLRDVLDNFGSKLKIDLAQKGKDAAQTRFTAAKAAAAAQFRKTMREGEEAEIAEIIAAMEYFELTGQSPPGYVITDAPVHGSE